MISVMILLDFQTHDVINQSLNGKLLSVDYDLDLIDRLFILVLESKSY